MIREFFAPRLALIFFVLTALIWVGLFAWLKGSKKQHRRWLTHARLPIIAGVASLALSAALAIFVQVFD
ncbi:MAG TPA: hypothetical protein VH183_13445 [Burkholderiaceae bacterium]|jgi:hypothetical protein|nr:hypothetical protein [Burkholderiaceae bacterium]